MERHIYYHHAWGQVAVFSATPEWIGPGYIFLGVVSLTAPVTASSEEIFTWTRMRCQLLGLPVNKFLKAVDYTA